MDPMPNVHPALVHFPIALLLAALVLDLVAIAGQRRAARGNPKHLICARCSGVVLILAAVGGLAALVSGFLAEDTVQAMKADAQLHEVLERHETAAIVTFVLAAALAVWRLVGRLAIPGGGLRWIYLGLLVAACVLVGVTGHLGGQMVYGHGVGVQPAAAQPASERRKSSDGSPMVQIDRTDADTLHIPRQGAMVTDAWIFARESLRIERDAVGQLCDAASIDPDALVCATPDIHVGYGVPIGCVWGTPHYISPAAVGYDINCGMRLMTTPLEAGDVDVRLLADSIRRDIPLGEGKASQQLSPRDMRQFLGRGVPAVAMLVADNPRFARAFREDELQADLQRIEDGGSMEADASFVPEQAAARGRVQFGTLGGGNHFIELQRVDRIFDAPLAAAWGLRQNQFVVMVHSGSRGLGHEVGGQFMKRALKLNEKRGDPLPNRQLMYLPLESKEGRAYFEAMKCAANFAYANRQVMATMVRHDIRHSLGDIAMPLVYDVAHNIAKFEMHDGRRLCVHRKGATRAFPASRMAGTPFAETGQPVLIPGSMGTASYLLVVVAESGRRSLFSVNHGAGRVMSRTHAAGKVTRKGKVLRPGAITDEAFREAMRGVYLVCEDRHHIKEEAPQAYKDIETVIDTVTGAGLARRVARMVPLAVLKG